MTKVRNEVRFTNVVSGVSIGGVIAAMLPCGCLFCQATLHVPGEGWARLPQTALNSHRSCGRQGQPERLVETNPPTQMETVCWCCMVSATPASAASGMRQCFLGKELCGSSSRQPRARRQRRSVRNLRAHWKIRHRRLGKLDEAFWLQQTLRLGRITGSVHTHRGRTPFNRLLRQSWPSVRMPICARLQEYRGQTNDGACPPRSPAPAAKADCSKCRILCPVDGPLEFGRCLPDSRDWTSINPNPFDSRSNPAMSARHSLEFREIGASQSQRRPLARAQRGAHRRGCGGTRRVSQPGAGLVWRNTDLALMFRR